MTRSRLAGPAITRSSASSISEASIAFLLRRAANKAASLSKLQSSGASKDFQQATQLARAMVTEYGMSDQLGPVQYEGQSGMFAGDAVPGQAPQSFF